jgi:hypothetical protein
MLSLRQKSKPRVSVLLLAAMLTLVATALVRPIAALAAPNVSFEPGSHDFGLQPVYSGAQTTMQLRNDGGEVVHVDSLEIVNSSGWSFNIGNSDCWGKFLDPGEACSIQVNFNPDQASELTASLRATVDSVQFHAELSGTGARPLFASQSNPVDFGVAKLGADGNTREITITNVGNWSGGLFIAVVSGGAVGSYQLLDENCTNREIAPAESCTLQVRFRPIAEGVKKATLSLFGEGDGGTQIVLTGVGAAPDPVPATPDEEGSGLGGGSAASASLPPPAATGPLGAEPAKAPHRPKVRPRKRQRQGARRGRRGHRQAKLSRARRIGIAG